MLCGREMVIDSLFGALDQQMRAPQLLELPLEINAKLSEVSVS
jgi:hypothetical protein